MSKDITMTHDELVTRAERWLKGTMKCGVILAESHTAYGERPDAIGWKYGVSILVECKASRADFHADARKIWRRHPRQGMGSRRYYMVPAGLIEPEEVPAEWGLLWVFPTLVRVKRHAWKPLEANLSAERNLLYVTLRDVFLEKEERMNPTFYWIKDRTGEILDRRPVDAMQFVLGSSLVISGVTYKVIVFDSPVIYVEVDMPEGWTMIDNDGAERLDSP